MLFKSQLLSQASGAMGGTVASRNRFGQYLRRRAIPVNPSTPQQIAVRSVFATLSNYWTDILTQVERDAWTLYADNVPITNRLGDSIILTGLNMFQRTNSLLVQAGEAILETAPGIFSLAETDPSLVLTATEASPYLSLAFDNTLGWATEAGGFMLVYQSRPVAPSIQFFGGPYRLAGSIAGATPTAPTSPQTFEYQFPAVAGQKVFAGVRIVRADGRVSPFFRSVDIVG